MLEASLFLFSTNNEIMNGIDKILEMSSDNHFFVDIYKRALQLVKDTESFVIDAPLRATNKENTHIAIVTDRINTMKSLLPNYINSIENSNAYSVFMNILNSTNGRKHLDNDDMLVKIAAQDIMRCVVFDIGYEINQGHALALNGLECITFS